jgi:hypothetical protein
VAASRNRVHASPAVVGDFGGAAWSIPKLHANSTTRLFLKRRRFRSMKITEDVRRRADHLDRRAKPKDYAVWEIHPVMALYVHQ